MATHGSSKAVKMFDAVVIGSGQSGTPMASALAQSGQTAALIERSHIGGTCINEGCTPTKTMIASGRVAHMSRRANEFGIWDVPAQNLGKGHKAFHSKDEGDWEQVNVAVEMQKVRQRKRDIVNSFRAGSESRLKDQENLEVIMGEASFKDAHSVTVKLSEGSGELEVHAKTFIINTGERPARPDLPGLDSVDPTRVLDSTTIMELGEVPHHLVVLGGGYVGLEFGQLFRRLGSRVTIIQRGNQLAPREDSEVAEALQEILVSEGIEVLLSTTVTNVKINDCCEFEEKITVTYRNEEGCDEAVNGSHVLLAAGRMPNSDTLNLAVAGVEMDARGHIKVDSTLHTTVPHIYAIGDVHGGPAFTHVSYDDFRILRSNLIDKSSTPLSTENRQIPYVVYTDPQLGHIGMHEHEARTKFPDAKIQTATMPMAYVARALEVDESQGLMKAVVNGDTSQILGFTCLGMEGGELMAIVQTAMLGKLSYKVLQNAVFAHPSLAESLNNLWGFLK